jgi:cell division protein FtsL
MSALAERVAVGSAKRERARRPVTGGVLWIVVLAALLAGIVAVNVIVLQLNVQLDGLTRQRAELRADNAKLRAQLSSAAANARIARDARDGLGLVAADPATTTYVRLAP